MKQTSGFVLVAIVLASCMAKSKDNIANAPLPKIVGTWRLVSGAVTENNKTTVTDYTKNVTFIKILNDTHFAFLQHDVNKGKDSAAAVYVSGGGRYSLKDSSYTEHLEYCSAREWEGNDFTFTIHIANDTLVQSGVEKVDSAGINRLNVEKYVRVK
jgi:hypothetical protein